MATRCFTFTRAQRRELGDELAAALEGATEAPRNLVDVRRFTLRDGRELQVRAVDAVVLGLVPAVIAAAKKLEPLPSATSAE